MDLEQSKAFFKELKKMTRGQDPSVFRNMVNNTLDDMPNLTISERVSVKRVMEALYAEESEKWLRQRGESICWQYFQNVKKKRMNEHMVN